MFVNTFGAFKQSIMVEFHSMLEALKPKDYMVIFSTLPIGKIIGIPISYLTPTQPDDERHAVPQGPIEACYDSKKILIIHGNHRYYDLKRRKPYGNPKIQVRKIINPFTDIKA